MHEYSEELPGSGTAAAAGCEEEKMQQQQEQQQQQQQQMCLHWSSFLFSSGGKHCTAGAVEAAYAKTRTRLKCTSYCRRLPMPICTSAAAEQAGSSRDSNEGDPE
jgi:hypothetical protein